MNKMKKICSVLVSFCFFCMLPVLGEIRVIPYPEKVIEGKGSFLISPNTKVCFVGEELQEVADFYLELIESASGVQLQKAFSGDNAIYLQINPKLKLSSEGYTIEVKTGKTRIESATKEGLFYGIQTLNQLFNFDSQKGVTLPVVNIEDSPRFGYRGCMLDVSRTFMDKKLLMRYMDLMAQYKFNVLHLHLIDDQGWRLEIKRYPLLTSVGSKYDSEFNEMGGYYTQNEIQELVKYALQRNITIIPEFELPGHECAAIASYPELACKQVRPKIAPYFMGDQIHKEIFCAGNPDVYQFVYNVLDEVMALFPSEYIHIGGDEAPKTEWKECERCQQVIRKNNLKDEEELQSFFVKEVGEYLKKKGRKLIGWDEILDGKKLEGDETIMYWRGWMPQQIEEAARQGFPVVSCPNSHCYFDYTYDRIDTRKAYSYEPVPTGTPAIIADNYIGVQANFWSHIDRCEHRIDQQLFPRLFALSEVAWCRPYSKDWKRFKKNAKWHSEKLRSKHVNCYYDKSIYNPE